MMVKGKADKMRFEETTKRYQDIVNDILSIGIVDIVEDNDDLHTSKRKKTLRYDALSTIASKKSASSRIGLCCYTQHIPMDLASRLLDAEFIEDSDEAYEDCILDTSSFKTMLAEYNFYQKSVKTLGSSAYDSIRENSLFGVAFVTACNTMRYHAYDDECTEEYGGRTVPTIFEVKEILSKKILRLTLSGVHFGNRLLRKYGSVTSA